MVGGVSIIISNNRSVFIVMKISIFFSSKILENISSFLWCNYRGGGWVNLKSLRGLSLGREMASTASSTTILQDCKIFLQAAVYNVYNVLLIQYKKAIKFLHCLEKYEPYSGAQTFKHWKTQPQGQPGHTKKKYNIIINESNWTANNFTHYSFKSLLWFAFASILWWSCAFLFVPQMFEGHTSEVHSSSSSFRIWQIWSCILSRRRQRLQFQLLQQKYWKKHTKMVKLP